MFSLLINFSGIWKSKDKSANILINLVILAGEILRNVNLFFSVGFVNIYILFDVGQWSAMFTEKFRYYNYAAS